MRKGMCFLRTQHDALAILREAALRCGLIYDGRIRDAYLYGSYARGDYHEESDVDILLTADASAEEISRHRDAVAHVSSELSLANDVTVSLTVKPYAQFLRYGEAMPYYRNVRTEGIRYDG